jgi:site-specific recombinase XerD
MSLEEQVSRFEKYWRRRKPTSSTAAHYSSDVRIFFRWAQGSAPESITIHQVDEFIEWQREYGQASATIQRRLVALHTFYDFLGYVQDQEITNPVVPQRHYIDLGHHLPRNLHENAIEKLFITISDHLRDRAIFTLMLHAGLRVGEIVNLGLGDVYLFETSTPHLRLKGKGDRERIAYLSAKAARLLGEYLSSRPGTSKEHLFLNRRGKPITITGIQLQLAMYCQKAGIWVTCHQLRHTFACRMIAAGVPVTFVQKMLGHSSLKTTQLYIEVSDRQVEQDYHAGIRKLTDIIGRMQEVEDD